MTLINVDKELYIPFYESSFESTLSKKDIETAKNRYLHRSPEGIHVVRGNGKLLLCMKVEDAEFTNIGENNESPS